MNSLLSISRTTEVSAATIRMLAIFKQHKDNHEEFDQFLEQSFAILEAQSERMTKVINKSRMSPDLNTKDASRDEAVRSLHYLIMGYLNHPDEQVKSAAATVNKVFQQYGLSIINKNYATETALIESLLKDLDNEDVKSALTSLSGMQQTIENLRAINTRFINARIEYEQELAAASNSENATSIKREMLETINAKIIVYLTAMSTANPEHYLTLASEIEQVVNTNNETIRKRSKRRSNNAEKEVKE